MMDGISPLPRREADARYDLSRLAELLPLVEQHLRALGCPGEFAGQAGIAAHDLRRRISALREATLREQARQVRA